MPNGDCTVGARVEATQAAQGREIGEMKEDISECQTAVAGIKMTLWKVGILIIMMLTGFETFGKPLVQKLINGGG